MPAILKYINVIKFMNNFSCAVCVCPNTFLKVGNIYYDVGKLRSKRKIMNILDTVRTMRLSWPSLSLIGLVTYGIMNV